MRAEWQAPNGRRLMVGVALNARWLESNAVAPCLGAACPPQRRRHTLFAEP